MPKVGNIQMLEHAEHVQTFAKRKNFVAEHPTITVRHLL